MSRTEPTDSVEFMDSVITELGMHLTAYKGPLAFRDAVNYAAQRIVDHPDRKIRIETVGGMLFTILRTQCDLDKGNDNEP